MKIFFDSEFTGLHQNTTLISIGLVSETDNTFYAELTDFDKNQINKWLQDNVINKLQYTDLNSKILNDSKKNFRIKGNKKEVRNALISWLGTQKIQFYADCSSYDFVLLIDLLCDSALNLPTNISPYCHDINQDIAEYLKINDAKAFDISREKMANIDNCELKHTALYDAMVCKHIYCKISNL